MNVNPVDGKIILAPMEGVVDACVRHLLTEMGGVDQCVTEFIRITEQVLPRKEFMKRVPELAQGCQTSAGIPVVVQLLGSEPEMLGRNALKAVRLGAPCIDLNFGCPSKTVNRHRGGAVLLDEPELVYTIIKTVREWVPETVPVTAKMRLGNRDKSLALDNACAVQEAGASGLTIHARTKAEGYKPPAHWEWVARIKEAVQIPIVANGEVWTPEDYFRCREISGCQDVMIGRGLIARPELGLMIRSLQQGESGDGASWAVIVQMLLRYFDHVEAALPERYVHGRIKQWLQMMKPQREEACRVFEDAKRLKALPELRYCLEKEL